MSDNIPEEVMVSILLRLRVKDLVSCRRVSKQWLSIIDDPHFISRQLQLSISTNSNAALYLQDIESPILYWKKSYDCDVDFFSTPIHYEPTRVLLMGSCHGLVCFSLFDHPDDFIVLNPSTGERHTVRCPIVEKRSGERLEAYGFGYDESSDDYKVVRIIQTHADSDSYISSYRAEINCVRSKGFSRTIPYPSADRMHYRARPIGVFVGSSIHWCALHYRNDDPYEHFDAIDIVSNTYHKLQCPDDYNFGETCFVTLNIGIVDTLLSLCAVHEEQQKVSIWVMKEYGNPESWNRIYYVDYHRYFPQSVNSVGSNGDKILLILGRHGFSWCDPSKNEDGTTLYHDVELRYGAYEAVYCLESLVKIFPNQAASVKKDAYEKQLKRLADQEIPQSGHPAFIDLRNLNSLMIEYYYESDEE